tara:strand:- start:330 stop:545 length:216 start_codon:yes stop_codon:yes gene_type:complete
VAVVLVLVTYGLVSQEITQALVLVVLVVDKDHQDLMVKVHLMFLMVVLLLDFLVMVEEVQELHQVIMLEHS